jgi:hypothetical protein
LYVFLAAALPSARDSAVAERSAYLRSSEQRRLVLENRAAFARNRITVPEPSDYPGEEYVAGFERTLDAVAAWLEASV